MKLGFMTFVCPDWDLEMIPRFARKAGYDGVEIRVDAEHKHGLSSRSSYKDRAHARKLFAREGIEVPCVATSVQFAWTDLDQRNKNIAQAKADIKLAAHLGATKVRIFAGPRESKVLTPELAQAVGDAFTEVGDYAAADGVRPMLETGHDIIKGKGEALQVIAHVRTPNFGVLWNHSSLTADEFEVLQGYLTHFHVHEEILAPDNQNIRGLATMLKQIDYTGYISLEIIRNRNMEEEELLETARRLNQQISEG